MNSDVSWFDKIKLPLSLKIVQVSKDIIRLARFLVDQNDLENL